MNKNSVERTAPLIVGVGASAGGLEAFQELLLALNTCEDLAVVFVQHLEKGGEVLLVELLAKSTECPVVIVDVRRKVRAGTVYVCPPWTLLEIKNGVLRIATPENADRPAAPIDHFLHSLAIDQRDRGVGVILSGTGSDGTLGLKAISDGGGLTFAQLPESAKYDSMPRSAATTGVADHVLAPEKISVELKRYVAYLADVTASQQHANSTAQLQAAIPAISKILMDATNHNFQHYKQSTLMRRIRRRMQVLRYSSVETYVSFLQSDPDEPGALFRELLISVTAFFRDPEAYEILAKTVIPQIFAKADEAMTVRIWVPGCATGEEAFTLAMLCREHMDTLTSPPEVQIFATDIDERALKISRQGIYPVGIEEDVSAARLKRFFIKRGKKYQVMKELRELVLFSAHNLISDPPFSRLDLISCRNLLIYLGAHLQKKLIPLFHYALRSSGFLMLGPSENISSHRELFRPVDAVYRISQRKNTGVDASAALNQEVDRTAAGAQIRPVTTNTAPGEDLMQIMQRIVLDEFAPKSVIISEDGKVVCASADMHKYLTVGTGNFQNNIIRMARPGLRIGLRAALQEAKEVRRRVVHDDLSVSIEGKLQRVMITVQPMPRVGESDELFMVLFHDAGLPLAASEAARDAADHESGSHDRHVAGSADSIIAHLERELASTRSDLEKSIQEFESANEELKSSNEELLSLNEEMQSANEELETSREEIQAVANALETAHSDLENLLRSTQIATVFLDDQLRIRSFTPAATHIYGLIPTDIGRPLAQLMPLCDDIPTLPDPQIVDQQTVHETTIQTRAGRWFVRRVLPYYSRNGEKQGIVVTFHDVTELQAGRQRFASLVEASAQIVWETNAEGLVTEDSPSWRAFTGQSVDQWLGTGWLDALHPDYRESTLAAWKHSTDTG
ncbi:MAG: PAS domain-containing protein, partial [Planctomycetaceae bacterium]|nr:PAS domain-containing protein [Planctomycetaceae bacterium]